MFRKIIIATVFLGNTLLFGQAGSIKGRIIDVNDGEELPFANVQLSRCGGVIRKTVTDLEGNFSFTKLEPGRYEMKVAYVGYKTCELPEVKVTSDAINYQNIGMEPSAIIICDLVICERALTNYDGCIVCRGLRTCCCDYIYSVLPDTSEPEKKSAPQDTSETICKVYPNPFMDYAMIEITSAMDLKWGAVQLFDLNGKKVREIDFSSKMVVVGREGLSSGTYIYQVTSDNRSLASGRIIVQ